VKSFDCVSEAEESATLISSSVTDLLFVSDKSSPRRCYFWRDFLFLLCLPALLIRR